MDEADPVAGEDSLCADGSRVWVGCLVERESRLTERSALGEGARLTVGSRLCAKSRRSAPGGVSVRSTLTVGVDCDALAGGDATRSRGALAGVRDTWAGAVGVRFADRADNALGDRLLEPLDDRVTERLGGGATERLGAGRDSTRLGPCVELRAA